MVTFYVTRDKTIVLQSNDWNKINQFTGDACKEAECKQDRSLGFTVYKRDGDKVFHVYHSWLSSGDGCMHSRSYHPPHEVTEMFNNEYR